MASENSLLTLAIIAVLVSAVAMFASFGAYDTSVSLSPNETGNVSVDVSQDLNIKFNVDTIDFKSGSVTTGSQYAQLDTGISGAAGSYTGWTPNGIPPSTNDIQGFQIENIGNVDVNLSIGVSNNSNEFVCAGAPDCIATGLAMFNYSVSNAQGTACDSNGLAFNNWRNVPKVTTPYAQPGEVACADFNDDDAKDALWVDVLIRVPATGTPTGARKATFYATARASATPTS